MRRPSFLILILAAAIGGSCAVEQGGGDADGHDPFNPIPEPPGHNTTAATGTVGATTGSTSGEPGSWETGQGAAGGQGGAGGQSGADGVGGQGGALATSSTGE